MQIHLWDELDVTPDVERTPRLWCCECNRATAYRYDQFDMPVCLEHADEDEVAHV